MKRLWFATVCVVLSIAAISTPATADKAQASGFMADDLMPGAQVVRGRVIYEGGSVVLVPAPPGAFDSCPSGWVCLFEDANWQGNMLQFNSCCAWNNLSAFGFDNIASSWRNRMSVDAQIAKNAGGGGVILCLNNGASSSSMPAGWDNNASSIRGRNSSTVC